MRVEHFFECRRLCITATGRVTLLTAICNILAEYQNAFQICCSKLRAVLDGEIDPFIESALAQRIKGGGPAEVADLE